jgi:transposase InsO family protein
LAALLGPFFFAGFLTGVDFRTSLTVVTGDGKRCDPFTITDAHSRYLIRCQIVSRTDLSQVRAICEAAMREYGVPARIRTDNGSPFAGTGLLGLSKLSLGWMKLGIVHERIQATATKRSP